MSGCQQAKSTPEVTSPAVEEIQRVVSVTSKIVPAERATLSFPIGGVLAELHVAEGDTVSAGQVLARLDASDLEASLAQARAALEVARAEEARLAAGPRPEEVRSAEATLRVALENVCSAEITVEAAKAKVEMAEAALRASKASLAKLEAGATSEEIEIARQSVEAAKG